jgi:hypothetical protein
MPSLRSAGVDRHQHLPLPHERSFQRPNIDNDQGGTGVMPHAWRAARGTAFAKMNKMSSTGLPVFDETIQKTNIWLKDISQARL